MSSVQFCREEAMHFLHSAAEAEKVRSPLAKYFREKAAWWFRRAAGALKDGL
jgi:hypothetical protein